MVEEVIAVGRSCQPSGIIRPGDVSPSRIKRMGGRAIQLVRDESERIGIKAFLCRHFAGRNDTGFDFEVTHVMGSEHTFDVNDGPFSVAFLDQWR